MMTLLHLISYLGGLAAFLFVTLSLASGLLWLAELIEEHSRYAKTIGIRAIYGIIALHCLLYFTDGLPFLPILFSALCHLVYLQNFSTSWPYISLTSPKFLLSCALVVGDHFLWFFHFAAKAQEAKKYRQPKYRYGGSSKLAKDDSPAFMDVAAFFAICVWFVPLFLFLSLSANDNALPSFGGTSSAPPSPRLGGSADGSAIDLTMPEVLSHRLARHQSPTPTPLLKSLLNPLVALLPRLRNKRRPNEEGLIAPRSPVRGSPLHSPVPMRPQAYVPWGDDPTSNPNGYSSPTVSRLSLDRPSSAPRSTPPPPKRVQSEAQVMGSNPRGLATRNGMPVVVDTESEVKKRPVSAGLGMSLGPQPGEGFIGGTEVVDAKRKAD